jgi:hypothetical protein
MSMGGPQVHGHSDEGSCQPGEIRRRELLSPPEQAHGDEEIRKEKDAGVWIRRLTDDSIRHGGDDGRGKDADGKANGPRYLFCAALLTGERCDGAG